MKWIKNYELYLESRRANSSVNTIVELCICMLLINPNFLDNLLDKGLKARYTQNSSVFLNDLKNLLLGNNRLKLAKFESGKWVVDNEISKITQEFNGYVDDFNIEKHWNKLNNARNLARGIQDKLLYNYKLTPESIRYVFWIGPNSNKENPEEIVVELNDGKQYSIIANSRLNTSKTLSFNTFADTLLGENSENLFNESFLPKWDKLIQEWIRIIYEGCKNEYKLLIEKFIDPDRIYSIGWFEYFNIKHRNKEYQNLGEHIPQFNKNILKFQDLMNEIYKNSDITLENPEEVKKEWEEKKIFILNSRIIEYLITSTFEKMIDEEKLEKSDDGMIISHGKLKERLMKLILDIMKVSEKYLYYISNNGNKFYVLPSRNFFREKFDELEIHYDHHVELVPSDDEDDNDSKFNMKLLLGDEELFTIDLMTKFSNKGISSSLSTKVKIEFDNRYNSKIIESK